MKMQEKPDSVTIYMKLYEIYMLCNHFFNVLECDCMLNRIANGV